MTKFQLYLWRVFIYSLTYTVRLYIIKLYSLTVWFIGGDKLNLDKYLPLTETTLYILLSLNVPGHGYIVMQKVEELSNGKVRIAAGTMYGALENLTKQNLISILDVGDKRRKVYKITELGKMVLQQETNRLAHIVSVAEKYGYKITEGSDC